ncbi:MAG: adenosine kinase [Alphaproteobacteria bacterium]|nr:adenosine kinase [Alphaproteobacteria bacterium]TAD90032.1 MAG: adenosine kinase [Alphaproteobacteria bacterium]
MAETRFDVVGIGNAIVDVIARCDEDFLVREHLTKNAMILVDEARSFQLYSRMGPGVEVSGGSAGNTMAAMAQLGSKVAYIGKVKADQLGQVFRHDMTSQGARFVTLPALDGPSTARCLVLVTPDGHRTMCTYLGACVELGPEDLDFEALKATKAVYMEGYLFDPPRAKAAFREAAKTVHAAGGKVALSLSDSFCVNRHKGEFRDLVENHVDILFANESEAMALTDAASFDEAAAALAGKAEVIAITRSEQGSVVLAGGTQVAVPAEPVARVVDTTGAGDLYAAGFLHAWARGLSPAQMAKAGAIAAAEIISHIGARPETPLPSLFRAALPEALA